MNCAPGFKLKREKGATVANSVPTFEIIGDGRLSDEAIDALAALLLAVAAAENSAAAQDEDQQEASSPSGRCA